MPTAASSVRHRRLCLAAGAVLLGLQLIPLLAARFTNTRYFCWAPYDEITRFELSVTLDGLPLSPREIQQRYRLPHPSRDNRSWAHVPAIVAHYERTLGRADAARVEYRYQVNGRPPLTWRWPAPAESAP